MDSSAPISQNRPWTKLRNWVWGAPPADSANALARDDGPPDTEEPAAGHGAGTEPPRNTEERRYNRHKVNWPARCNDTHGTTWQAVVQDTSRGGFGLRGCPVLDKDQVISVDLSGIGSFPCRVVWSNGDVCGVELLLETSQSDVNMLAAVIENIDQER